MALKQATVVLLLMIPLATAQSLQLVYIGRSGSQPGDNQITLECRRNTIAVSSPQIFVERSDLARQPVTIVGNQNGLVTVEVTQDLEGSYSCSDSGDNSTIDTLELVAYPQANLSIPSSYTFQEGQQATINCRVMPGKLSQYYSVRWMNDSMTIATSNPHSVLPVCQLHDNFSLTINNIQPSDSSTSYRCSVTIDDPRIPGTQNVVYDQSQLGLITVIVNEQPTSSVTSATTVEIFTPSGTPTVVHTMPPPGTPRPNAMHTMPPPGTPTPNVMLTMSPPTRQTLNRVYPPVSMLTMSSLTRSTVDLSATPTVMPTTSPSTLESWHIIVIVVAGVAVMVVLIIGCTCMVRSYRLIISKRSRITAEQEKLLERADKLEREAIEMANELPQDPDERKVKEDLISHKTQEASKLRDRAARLPQERYKDLLEQADQKQREEDEKIKNLSSDPQKAKLEKRSIEDIRKEKNALRKEAHRRMATDDGEEDNEDEDGGEQHYVQEDASGGGEPEATWHSTANPNTTV